MSVSITSIGSNLHYLKDLLDIRFDIAVSTKVVVPSWPHKLNERYLNWFSRELIRLVNFALVQLDVQPVVSCSIAPLDLVPKLASS